jgi:prevent-host-death family protein
VESSITATELARNLGDVLAKVRYRRESFVIERNGVAVARIVPVERDRTATLADLIAIWTSFEPDPEFADDLERVNKADRPPENPWES